MDQQHLGPLVNAAVLAGDVHQMRMQQQQLQPQSNINNIGGSELLQPPALPPLHHQHVVPQAAAAPLLRNVVHTTMYPPPATAIGGGQPLQSHPALPQLQQQSQVAPAAAAAPKKKADHTNYNHSNNNNTMTLNHPQNETYKLKTNQYFLETSSRLDDAVSELAHYSSLLSNNKHHTSSKSSSSSTATANTTECITNIEQSIIPLLKICSTAMKDAGKYFAPFSGTVNIHSRNDAEKKRRLVKEEDERVQRLVNEEIGAGGVVGGGGGKAKKKKVRRKRKKRPALLMIDEFVERSKVIVETTNGAAVDQGDTTTTMKTAAAAAATTGNDDQQQQQQSEQVTESPSQTSTRKRKTQSSNTTKSNNSSKTESIIILRPQNNTVYTKSEAIAICKHYRKNSRERGLAIRAMVQQKFVLASRKTLYRLLQQDEEGRVLLENGWLGCGRPMKQQIDLDGEVVDVGTGGVSNNGSGNGSQLLVNSSLTFEELDRGEENRILVELNKGGGENEEEEEGELSNSNNNNKQAKKRKRGKQSTPSSRAGVCKTPGCTNLISRRGLCIKHGLEQVDSKVISFPLPPPREGGTVYKKSECVEIAKQYKKGSSQRRLALEAMIYRGYAKNSLKSLYRLLLNDEKGIPIVDDDWRGMGCPSVLSAKEIDEVIERIKREDIRLASDKDVRQLVLDALKAKGVTDESKLKFSATTVKNYGAIFKSRLSTVYWRYDVESSQQQGMV